MAMLLRSTGLALAILAAPALASQDEPVPALAAILDHAEALEPLETVIAAISDNATYGAE